MLRESRIIGITNLKQFFTRLNALKVVRDSILFLLVDAEGGDCEPESRSGNDASYRVVIGVILGLLGGLLDLSKEGESGTVSSLIFPPCLTSQSICVQVELVGDLAIVEVKEGDVVDVVVGGVEVDHNVGTIVPVVLFQVIEARLDFEIELLTVDSVAKRVPCSMCEISIRGCLPERD